MTGAKIQNLAVKYNNTSGSTTTCEITAARILYTRMASSPQRQLIGQRGELNRTRPQGTIYIHIKNCFGKHLPETLTWRNIFPATFSINTEFVDHVYLYLYRLPACIPGTQQYAYTAQSTSLFRVWVRPSQWTRFSQDFPFFPTLPKYWGDSTG